MNMRQFFVAGMIVAAGIAGSAFAADTKAPAAAAAAAAPAGPVLDYKTVVPGTYTLDGSHVSVVWKIWHMGYSHFAGRFDKISGTATVNPDLSKSGVVITIDASSGNTGVAKLDEELDEPNFFNADKYPAITFNSTKVDVTGKTEDGKDKGKIYGTLSMKGVTKPVVLDVVFNGHGSNPMMAGQERMGFEASTKIKRSDFGLSYGIPMVSDEVELIIAAEFTKN